MHSERLFRVAVAIYAAGFVLTFGHSAASTRACTAPFSGVECAANVGAMSGLVWPLYWSWWAFEKGQPS